MLDFEHRVRRQSLELRCSDEELAIELRPRARELNERTLRPALEQVLAEFDAPELVELGRIELDLGVVSASELDGRLAERLVPALREAIVHAIARQAPGRRRSASAGLRELFAHYLVHGTLPPWAPRRGRVSLELLLLELAEADGPGLVSLLRALAGHRVVLERLVAQLSLEALGRLVATLEPRHAELVLTYIVELELTHRSGVLRQLSSRSFRRLVWLFALAYLIREHGTQFNRKTFVKQLVSELAGVWGLSYAELLASLWRGLEAVEERTPLRSLPAVVDTLVTELASSSRPESAKVEAPAPAPGSPEQLRLELRAARGHGLEARTRLVQELAARSRAPLPTLAILLVEELGLARTLAAVIPGAGPQLPRDLFEALLLAIFAADVELASAALRSLGELDRMLRRLVARARRVGLVRLVRLLEPQHAHALLGYIDELESCQRERELVPLALPSFMDMVWRFTLTYLLQRPDSHFNQLAYIEHLIASMARERGIEFDALLFVLHTALIELGRSLPLTSLLTLIEELQARRPPAARPRALPGPRRRPRPLAALLPLDPRWPDPESPSRRGLEAGPAQRLYDEIAALSRGLVEDTWAGTRSPDLGALLRALLEHPTLLASVFLQQPAALRRQGLARALALLEPDQRERLCAVLELDPELAALVPADPAALDERGAASQLIADLVTELDEGGQRTTMRASERGLLRALIRQHPRATLSMLAQLADSRPSWRRRLLADADTTLELIEAVSGQRTARALELLVELGGQPPAPPSVRERLFPELFERWFSAVRGGHSPDAQLRQMVEALPLPRSVHPSIAQRVLEACATAPVSDAEFAELATLVQAAAGASVETGTTAGRSASIDQSEAGSSTGELGSRLARLGAALEAGGRGLEPRELDELRRLAPAPLAALLEGLLRRASVRRRWVAALPEVALVALVDSLTPSRARELVAAVELLVGCWAQLPEGPTTASERAQLSRTLALEFLATTPRLDRKLDALVAHIYAELRARASDDRRTLARLHDLAIERSQERGHAGLLAALRATPVTGPTEPSDSSPRSGPPGHHPLDTATLDILLERVDALLGGVAPTQEAPAWLISSSRPELDPYLDLLGSQRPGRLADIVEARLSEPRTRGLWVQTLAETSLARLTELLAPRHARQLLAAAELLMGLWFELRPQPTPTTELRRELWTLVLGFLAATPPLDRQLASLVAYLFAQLHNEHGASRATLAQLRDQARTQALSRGQGLLRAALRRPGPRALSSPPSSTPAAVAPARAPTTGQPSASTFGVARPKPELERVYVNNAGLVLLSPFLPFWLDKLGHYDSDAKTLRLDDTDARSEAVHLLQWLVDGRLDAPEPELVLNKVLLGLEPSAVVELSHSPRPGTLELCEQLLRTAIQHWGAIGGTSLSGLRETFLQREGRLESAPERWSLTVQRKTVDVLVDQVPWPLSVISHGWMAKPLYVSW